MRTALILIFIIAWFSTSWAGGNESTTYYYSVRLSVKGSGTGKVYCSNTEGEPLQQIDNGNTTSHSPGAPGSTNTSMKFYFGAKATGKSTFSHFEDANGKKLTHTTSNNVNLCTVTVQSSQAKTDQTEAQNNPIMYYAVFEATAKEYIKVSAETGGAASRSGTVEQNTGDNITITASPTDPHYVFTGWKTPKGDIVTDNPYTVVANDANAGTYIAMFERHEFFRLKNYSTGHYAHFIDDTWTTAYNTPLNSVVPISDPLTKVGSIVRINEVHDFSVTHYTIEAQGEDTYSLTNLAYKMQYDDASQAWEFYNDGTYIAEKDNSMQFIMGSEQYTKWILEPLDNALADKQHYLSLDPTAFVTDGDGAHWTTLRAPFSLSFDSEQVMPYVVTDVNDAAGVMSVELLQGEVIPACTPILLRCQTTETGNNVLIPTTTAGTAPDVNLLKSCTKYFDNQNVENYHGITIINDKVGFGGESLSIADGNRAYLQTDNDVSLVNYQQATLAQVVAGGTVGEAYEVIDLTAVEVVDGDRLLICKDDNGYANPDVQPEGTVDFMRDQTTLTVPATYDQSNWIGLRLPEGSDGFTAGMMGHRLNGVRGRLTNKVNPELQLTELPTAGDENKYETLNTYIAASFHGQTQRSGVSDRVYFFVQPKPMELATVTWAYWDGDKFVAPPKVGSWNTANLKGEFAFNGAYLEGDGSHAGVVDLTDGGAPLTNHAYEMPQAVIKYKSGDFAHLYVLGNVNGLSFDSRKGVEMSTDDGVTYSARVTVTGVDNDDNGYFSFSTKLADTWEAIKTSRLTTTTSPGSDYWIEGSSSHYGEELAMHYVNYDSEVKAFRIPAGTYLLTVNLPAKTLIVTKPSQQAPRRAGTAAHDYVVYPLSLKENGSYVNGVITGVDGITTASATVTAVEYYNLSGRRGVRPWQGVNLVVTRYSDGTTTTAKVVR